MTAFMLAGLICYVLWAWYAALWTIGLIGWRTARRRYRLRPRSPLSSSPASDVPGVSVLRPLKGLDANLFENLESSLVQDYPKYEVIFAVADEFDQALGVVRDVIAKHPAVDTRISIGEETVGVNPKVNNLIGPYRIATYDILWVIDSNIQMARGAMARAVDALNYQHPSPSPGVRRIGLVHHVPFAVASQRPFGSQLEEAFLNTNHAKMYLALNALAVDSCVIGKSNMYRRSDIDQLTGTLRPQAAQGAVPDIQKGLAAFGRFIAEDNMIAGALWHELGLRHDLSCDVAQNAIGNMSFSTYFWRRVRWVRVRKHMVTLATVIEPFTESVFLGALVAWSVRRRLGVPVWLFIPVHMLLWLLVDLDIYASLAGHPVPSSIRLSFLRAWACRELLALPIWLFAIVGNDVSWRGTKYRVLRNGEVRRVDSESSTTAQRPLQGESQARKPLLTDVS